MCEPRKVMSQTAAEEARKCESIDKEIHVYTEFGSKDQESLTLKTDSYPDISNDDNDLPSALPQNNTKKKRFEKDDIVWLQFNKIYWPALVTNVSKKSSKIYVKVVNSRRKQKSFAVSAKRLLDFDDDKRNSELLELGKAKYPEIEKAYQRVTHFYCKKISGKNLSAARFLTYDSDDMFYGMMTDTEVNTALNGTSDQTQGANTLTESGIYKELHKLEEGETVLTEEERNIRTEKAWKLLEAIKSRECRNHLKVIYKGNIHSIRHEMFMTRERQKREYLRSVAGMSVFHDRDATKQLLSTLEEYYSKFKKHIYSKDYMYYVMLPEAIIFALQKVDNIGKADAIRIYNETSGEL